MPNVANAQRDKFQSVSVEYSPGQSLFAGELVPQLFRAFVMD